MTNRTEGTLDHSKPYPVGGQGLPGAYPVNGSLQPPRWSYIGPWASNEERLTQQALVVATIPGAQLQEMVRPPLPQIQVFPPRFGYGDRRVPSIDDIITVDRTYPEPRVSWYSGGVGSYSGSSRNSLAAV